MSYKIFYTDKSLPHGLEHPNYTTLIPIEESSEESAISKVFAILRSGAVVWRIEGPPPFLKERQAIRQMYFEATGKWPQ